MQTETLKCPQCGFFGDIITDFDCSLSDEVFCPECDWNGVLSHELDDEDELDD